MWRGGRGAERWELRMRGSEGRQLTVDGAAMPLGGVRIVCCTCLQLESHFPRQKKPQRKIPRL